MKLQQAIKDLKKLNYKDEDSLRSEIQKVMQGFQYEEESPSSFTYRESPTAYIQFLLRSFDDPSLKTYISKYGLRNKAFVKQHGEGSVGFFEVYYQEGEHASGRINLLFKQKQNSLKTIPQEQSKTESPKVALNVIGDILEVQDGSFSFRIPKGFINGKFTPDLVRQNHGLTYLLSNDYLGKGLLAMWGGEFFFLDGYTDKGIILIGRERIEKRRNDLPDCYRGSRKINVFIPSEREANILEQLRERCFLKSKRNTILKSSDTDSISSETLHEFKDPQAARAFMYFRDALSKFHEMKRQSFLSSISNPQLENQIGK